MIKADYRKNECLLIDVTIPSGRTPSVKEVEKLSKYKDLEIRIGKTWRMKTSTIPVVIGALSLINKGLMPGDIKMIKFRKCFMLETAHILYTIDHLKATLVPEKRSMSVPGRKMEKN